MEKLSRGSGTPQLSPVVGTVGRLAICGDPEEDSTHCSSEPKKQ